MNFSLKKNDSYNSLNRAIQLSILLLSCPFANSLDSQEVCAKPKKENVQNWPEEADTYTLEKTLSLHSMNLKRGVQLEGISPLWLRHFNDISKALPDLPITWVSGLEGQSHRNNFELHYDGKHLDLRVRDWPLVVIENREVVEGRELIDEALKNLNTIKGLEAKLVEKEFYPFIELHILEQENSCIP